LRFKETDIDSRAAIGEGLMNRARERFGKGL